MTIGVHEFYTFLLVFARVGALFFTAPVFGNKGIPKPTKIGFAALIAFALAPITASKVGPAPADMFSLVSAIGAETVVGLCLGLIVTLLLSAFQMAGYYVDTQMGFGIINILNPLTEQQTSLMGQFLYQAGMTLFLLAGGHLFLIESLAGSYNALPPGGAHFHGDLATAFIGMVSSMFVTAFKVAAPAGGILLIIDVAFGLIARSVPQMNVFIVGMPVKVIAGLLTLAVILPVLALMVGQMPSLIAVSMKAVLDAAK